MPLLESPGRYQVVEVDEPREREVLVRYVASGLCHGDVHFLTGDRVVASFTRRYSLDDINVAVDDLLGGRNIRGVIVHDR